MSDTPTAADLRAMALFNNLSPRQRAALLAGADAMDERDRLRADRAALTAALRPFALGVYPGVGEMPADGCVWEIPPGRTNGITSSATVGDSRRAAAALAEHGGERPAAVDDDALPKLSEMKGAFRDGAE